MPRPSWRRIDQGALALLLDHLHGGDELVAALAALRMKQVAGHALRMDPHQNRLRVLDGLAMVVEIADAPLAQGQMRLRQS